MATQTWVWASLTIAVTVILTVVNANSEGDALFTLRKSLSDPDNVLQSWDPTLVNPCTWFHITCNQDNRVTRVDLGNSNLSGHLVPELGRLEHLQYLYVFLPYLLHDSIPRYGNSFSFWELYKNNIQGIIPSELGNLKSLVSLDLYNNNISGTIPPSLGNLKSLVFLRLNDNRLTGPIPRDLANVSSLKVVDVSSNDLCGTIPTSGPFEHIPLNKFVLLLLSSLDFLFVHGCPYCQIYWMFELLKCISSYQWHEALRTILDWKVRSCWDLQVTKQIAREERICAANVKLS
ncbi:hypothetical protein SADUNF_Sadunf16G0115300 [Salix dunnii]|uniref:Leucine-rich repeat-containing N-terminal plant-type domain-containing protein n=1 Tax=Salix dunnii TaxID=1413687 RepID=A0A835J971_9ROSI|nr:hypothetical protein SADUNF_Sadunf16G0115300 [Salix dunnii]